jgi:hypothetical protein
MSSMDRIAKLPLWLILIGHFLLLGFTYAAFYCFGTIHTLPSASSLMQWDASWYRSIVDSGYSYVQDSQSNVAFFPLFPYLWKITGVGAAGISLINLSLLIAGMSILRAAFRIDNAVFLLLLSIPSLFFCYVPYAEALFYFSCSIAFYGLARNSPLIAFAGIFLACMSRSAAMVLLPVILFFSLYNIRSARDIRKHGFQAMLFVAAAVSATLLVQFIQHGQTGKFFVIFEAQQQWDRVMSIPSLPLTTWGGADLLWLDGMAFLTGVFAIIFCLMMLIRKVSHFRSKGSSAGLLAAGYLAIVTLITLIYSGKDPYGSTSIYSLNRFVFSTPFFSVFIWHCFRYFRLSRKTILLFVLVSVSSFLLLGAYTYLRELERFPIPIFKTKIYFGLMFLYALTYLLMLDNGWRHKLLPGVYLFNVALQVLLLHQFLTGGWVG